MKVKRKLDHFFENTWNRHGNGSWIHVSIYNLDIRNKKVGKPSCQEFEDEQDLAYLKSQGIYQKSDNQLEELKDASVVSQTRSSRADGMFNGDLQDEVEVRKSNASFPPPPENMPCSLNDVHDPSTVSTDIFRHESTTVDDVIQSPRASGSSMTQLQFRYNNIRHVEASQYFLNQFYDILYADFESYWINLQYGRYCVNGRLEEQFCHPPSVVRSLDFRTQFYWSWRPPAVPGMPPPFISYLHDYINQCVPYSLPIFSGGTGTSMPILLAYHEVNTCFTLSPANVLFHFFLLVQLSIIYF